MIPKLGKLSQVELRTIWKKEDRHFTPWLAQEENLQILGETIGLQLEFVEQEKTVGSYRVDIVCKNIADDSFIIIENQLEKADHDHLGKLLTYAAGSDAVTIIWVAESFSDEHRAALDWLNKNTNGDIHFFGLKIEAWKIGNSEVAPKFNIISQPNDWRKGVSRKVREKDNDYQNLRLKYWEQLSTYIGQHHYINLATPSRRGREDFSTLGRTGAYLRLTISKQKRKIGAALHLDPIVKSLYDKFYEQKDDIEANFGEHLEWNNNDSEKKAAIIKLEKEANIENEKDWDELHEWSKEQLEKFTEVFKPKLKK